MFLHIKKAVYVKDYIIRLTFSDGSVGDVDLKNELYGEVFTPLNELSQFRDFMVDPIMETLTWKNGADFAPEFLFDRAKMLV